MLVNIPNDLKNKSEKEIREMILSIGVVPFSVYLVSYLEKKENLEKLRNDLELLEKIAITIDSVLAYYQMTKITSKIQDKPLIDSKLVNKFIELYSSSNKGIYESGRK